jgi:hypothetical protein
MDKITCTYAYYVSLETKLRSRQSRWNESFMLNVISQTYEPPGRHWLHLHVYGQFRFLAIMENLFGQYILME